MTGLTSGAPPRPSSAPPQFGPLELAIGPDGAEKSSERTAFVLAGGGWLGATQVGMLYALLEAGIAPDLLVGSSVGAINGACLAGHATLEGVERLADFWTSVRRRDLFPIELRAIVAGLRGRRNHLCDPLALRTLILRAEPGFGRLEEAPVPFFPIAADLANGEAVVLSTGDVVEAIMASAAVPGIFPPVDIGGRMLIDGSVVTDGPLREAEALGATTIYVLPTAAPSDTVTCRRAIDVAARAMFLPAHQLAITTPKKQTPRVDVHVVPPPSMAGHSLIDFRATTELLDRSYQDARAWLAELRPVLVA